MLKEQLDQVVILASSAPLTGRAEQTPAPLAALGGLSLVKRAVQVAARRAQLRRMVIVAQESLAGIEAALRQDAELQDLELHFIEASPAEGLLQAAQRLEGEYFVTRAELVLEPTFYHQLQALPKRAGLSLALSTPRAGATGQPVELRGEHIGAVGRGDLVDVGLWRAGPELGATLQRQRQAGQALSLERAVQSLAEAGQLWGARAPASAWWQPVHSEAQRKEAQRLLFRSLTKPIDGPVSKAINRRFSKQVTRLVMNFNVVPNHMTAVGLVVGLLAAVLTAIVTPQTLWLLPIGGVLYQLSSMLDGVDGEIARLKFKHSDWGEWFDTVSDDVINLSYQLSVGIAAWRLSGNNLWLQIGLATFVLGWVVCFSLYRKLLASGKGTHLAIEWSCNDTTAQRSWFQRFCARFMFVGKRDFYALVLMGLSFFGMAGLQWLLVLSFITVAIVATQWGLTLLAAAPQSHSATEPLKAAK